MQQLNVSPLELIIVLHDLCCLLQGSLRHPEQLHLLLSCAVRSDRGYECQVVKERRCNGLRVSLSRKHKANSFGDEDLTMVCPKLGFSDLSDKGVRALSAVAAVERHA